MNGGMQLFDVIGSSMRFGVADDGRPYVVAEDFAPVLGYSRARNALRAVDEDEKGAQIVSTPGGPQQMDVLYEDGIWELIFLSRKPEAKLIKKQVKAILRKLREDGFYGQLREMPSHAETLRAWAAEIEAREAIEARNSELEPKAAQADQHREADGLIAVGDFANKIKRWAQKNNGVKVLHPQVWDFLGEIGLIIRGNTIRRNQPTAFAVQRDLVRAKETEYETNRGEARVSSSPRLTPAGEGWAWDRAIKRIAERGSPLPPVDGAA